MARTCSVFQIRRSNGSLTNSYTSGNCQSHVALPFRPIVDVFIVISTHLCWHVIWLDDMAVQCVLLPTPFFLRQYTPYLTLPVSYNLLPLFPQLLVLFRKFFEIHVNGNQNGIKIYLFFVNSDMSTSSHKLRNSALGSVSCDYVKWVTFHNYMSAIVKG